MISQDEGKGRLQAGGRADTGHRAADFQGEKGSGLDGLFRLQSLQIYNELKGAQSGDRPLRAGYGHIVTYVRPNTRMTAKWSEVPQDIKDTFERLGIPKAEQIPGRCGRPVRFELVYHNVRQEVAEAGRCVYRYGKCPEREYADMVRKHFMKLVKPTDHKFAALHGAVWSGGSFVYVPPGVSEWKFRCSPISG